MRGVAFEVLIWVLRCCSFCEKATVVRDQSYSNYRADARAVLHERTKECVCSVLLFGAVFLEGQQRTRHVRQFD